MSYDMEKKLPEMDLDYLESIWSIIGNGMTSNDFMNHWTNHYKLHRDGIHPLIYDTYENFIRIHCKEDDFLEKMQKMSRFTSFLERSWIPRYNLKTIRELSKEYESSPDIHHSLYNKP